MAIRKIKPKKIRYTESWTWVLGGMCLVGVVVIGTSLVNVGLSTATPEVIVPDIISSNDSIELPVPVRAITRGTRLKDVEFRMIEWPRTSQIEFVVRDKRAFQNAVAISSLPAYTPVVASAISNGPVDGNAVAEKIPEGMRAITVTVTEEAAIEGWAQSGSYVDVIAITTTNQGKEMQARVIAENVKILSAGRSTVPNANVEIVSRAPDTVTLLCEQADCLRIKMAAKIGTLTFSLRGLMDQMPTTTVSMSENNMFGSSKLVETASISYKGYARGPNGEQYVLPSQGSRWKRKTTKAADSLNNESTITRAQMKKAEAVKYGIGGKESTP